MIALSLSVNFEECTFRRVWISFHAVCLSRQGGLVLLVLPSSCVLNIWYCNTDWLQDVLQAVRLRVVQRDFYDAFIESALRRDGRGLGKAHWPDLGRGWKLFGKRVLVRFSVRRNNVYVFLDIGLLETGFYRPKGVGLRLCGSIGYRRGRGNGYCECKRRK